MARKNGIPPDLAARYMERIGDNPELDADGKAIVRDENGKILARVIFS